MDTLRIILLQHQPKVLRNFPNNLDSRLKLIQLKKQFIMIVCCCLFSIFPTWIACSALNDSEKGTSSESL
jgi:hypothetical protein